MEHKRAAKVGLIAAAVAMLAGGTAAVGTGTAATAATPTASIRYLGWATVFGDVTVAEFRTSNGRRPTVATSGSPGFFFVTFPAANPVTNFNHAAVQVSVLNEFHVTCVVGTRHVDNLTHNFTAGVECRNLDTNQDVNAAFSLLVLV